jgi:DNA-binding transcriptional regulator YdaS (Cro superfamily)
MHNRCMNALATFLALKGNTAVALARALAVNHATVLRWASGRVPASRVADVARVTGLPASDLRPDLAAAFGAAPGQRASAGEVEAA